MTYLFPRSIILVIRQSFDLAMLATNMCLVAWMKPYAESSKGMSHKTKQKGIERYANHN